jgi:hypothetical protein
MLTNNGPCSGLTWEALKDGTGGPLMAIVVLVSEHVKHALSTFAVSAPCEFYCGCL